MRLCSKCSKDKSLSEFYLRKTGSRSGGYYEMCRECFKQRGRKYYHQNHERQLKLALARKQRYKEVRQEFLAKIKSSPCSDCGKIYAPWIMDFDHRDAALKIASVSWLALHNTANMEKIKAEIAKCDLVCSNCHRQRTHDRLIKKLPQ